MENNIEIIKVESDILIREPEKRFIKMWKFPDSHWCYALPIKTMYLNDLDYVKNSIKKDKEFDKTQGVEREHRIAEITNT